MSKAWMVKSSEFQRVSSIDEMRALLCKQLRVEHNAMHVFFDPQYDEAIHQPHELYQMEEAVDRIFYAIKKNEHIIVYGDYDADGVTSTALLISVLEMLGARVAPFLPHRLDDGYGMNMRVIQQLALETSLIITVDCGVANIDEIEWLGKNNVDVVVVDHHEMKESLPSARAVLHPRHPEGEYPFGFLCGAGMAWKFSQALLRDKRSSFAHDRDAEKWLLDLAMLGTVADIVPLLGENRSIVQFGLEVLKRTKRPGLKALMRMSNVDIGALNVTDVGFRIVPRLNAPGRLDHAQPALDLLLAKNASRADELARALEGFNKLRQSISRKVAKEAELQVKVDSAVVFAYNISWPAGIVGLAANQLAKKFGRPAIVVGGNGRHAVGSARTPDGFNIIDILQPYKDDLLAMGGHAHAAGFSLLEEGVVSFGKKISSASVENTQSQSTPEIVQGMLDHRFISWEMAELIQKFEPFGEGNRQPQFIFKRLPVISARQIGKEGKHAKFLFDVNGKAIEGIGFSLGGDIAQLGEYVDVIACPLISHYRGRTRMELSVQGVASAGVVELGVQDMPISKEAVH